jgi:hypothetical protein
MDGSTQASCTQVIPAAAMVLPASASPSTSSSMDLAGTRSSTRSQACHSLSVPSGLPSGLRRIQPSRGSGVEGPIPARSSAAVLHQTVW